MQGIPVTKLSLSFSAKDVNTPEFFTSPNVRVVLFQLELDHTWSHLGQTECVGDYQSPQFTHPIHVYYYPTLPASFPQKYRAALYQIKTGQGETLKNTKFLGHHEFNLAPLLQTKSETAKLCDELNQPLKYGTITVTAMIVLDQLKRLIPNYPTHSKPKFIKPQHHRTTSQELLTGLPSNSTRRPSLHDTQTFLLQPMGAPLLGCSGTMKNIDSNTLNSINPYSHSNNSTTTAINTNNTTSSHNINPHSSNGTILTPNGMNQTLSTTLNAPLITTVGAHRGSNAVNLSGTTPIHRRNGSITSVTKGEINGMNNDNNNNNNHHQNNTTSRSESNSPHSTEPTLPMKSLVHVECTGINTEDNLFLQILKADQPIAIYQSAIRSQKYPSSHLLGNVDKLNHNGNMNYHSHRRNASVDLNKKRSDKNTIKPINFAPFQLDLAALREITPTSQDNTQQSQRKKRLSFISSRSRGLQIPSQDQTDSIFSPNPDNINGSESLSMSILPGADGDVDPDDINDKLSHKSDKNDEKSHKNDEKSHKNEDIPTPRSIFHRRSSSSKQSSSFEQSTLSAQSNSYKGTSSSSSPSLYNDDCVIRLVRFKGENSNELHTYSQIRIPIATFYKATHLGLPISDSNSLNFTFFNKNRTKEKGELKIIFLSPHWDYTFSDFLTSESIKPIFSLAIDFSGHPQKGYSSVDSGHFIRPKPRLNIRVTSSSHSASTIVQSSGDHATNPSSQPPPCDDNDDSEEIDEFDPATMEWNQNEYVNALEEVIRPIITNLCALPPNKVPIRAMGFAGKYDDGEVIDEPFTIFPLSLSESIPCAVGIDNLVEMYKECRMSTEPPVLGHCVSSVLNSFTAWVGNTIPSPFVHIGDVPLTVMNNGKMSLSSSSRNTQCNPSSTFGPRTSIDLGQVGEGKCKKHLNCSEVKGGDIYDNTKRRMSVSSISSQLSPQQLQQISSLSLQQMSSLSSQPQISSSLQQQSSLSSVRPTHQRSPSQQLSPQQLQQQSSSSSSQQHQSSFQSTTSHHQRTPSSSLQFPPSSQLPASSQPPPSSQLPSSLHHPIHPTQLHCSGYHSPYHIMFILTDQQATLINSRAIIDAVHRTHAVLNLPVAFIFLTLKSTKISILPIFDDFNPNTNPLGPKVLDGPSYHEGQKYGDYLAPNSLGVVNWKHGRNVLLEVWDSISQQAISYYARTKNFPRILSQSYLESEEYAFLQSTGQLGAVKRSYGIIDAENNNFGVQNQTDQGNLGSNQRTTHKTHHVRTSSGFNAMTSDYVAQISHNGSIGVDANVIGRRNSRAALDYDPTTAQFVQSQINQPSHQSQTNQQNFTTQSPPLVPLTSKSFSQFPSPPLQPLANPHPVVNGRRGSKSQYFVPMETLLPKVNIDATIPQSPPPAMIATYNDDNDYQANGSNKTSGNRTTQYNNNNNIIKVVNNQFNTTNSLHSSSSNSTVHNLDTSSVISDDTTPGKHHNHKGLFTTSHNSPTLRPNDTGLSPRNRNITNNGANNSFGNITNNGSSNSFNNGNINSVNNSHFSLQPQPLHHHPSDPSSRNLTPTNYDKISPSKNTKSGGHKVFTFDQGHNDSDHNHGVGSEPMLTRQLSRQSSTGSRNDHNALSTNNGNNNNNNNTQNMTNNITTPINPSVDPQQPVVVINDESDDLFSPLPDIGDDELYNNGINISNNNNNHSYHLHHDNSNGKLNPNHVPNIYDASIPPPTNDSSNTLIRILSDDQLVMSTSMSYDLSTLRQHALIPAHRTPAHTDSSNSSHNSGTPSSLSHNSSTSKGTPSSPSNTSGSPYHSYNSGNKATGNGNDPSSHGRDK